MATSEGHYGGELDFRLPCSICCRKFAPEALERHAKICEKSSQKKRKAFDSAKQRIQGTDIPTVSSAPPQLISTPSTRQSIRKKTPVGKQKKHEGNSKGKPLPPPLSLRNRLTADLVHCPSCERSFSEKAAERHIPWCKEKNSRIPRSPPCTNAKDRLNARTQYKAPLPGKRRYSPTRNVSPTKVWPLAKNNCGNEVPQVVADGSQEVKITGTTITAQLKNSDGKKPIQVHNSETEDTLNRAYGGSNGMIHSTSWEWVTPRDDAKGQRISASGRLPKSEETDAHYDPYTSAQRQMQELMFGTSLPTSQSPKLITPPNRTSPKQPEDQPRSNHSSQWSLESDAIEDVEEMIEELDIEDDQKYEQLINLLNKGGKSSRHPRHTVSCEEALFGTKNSLGSQDSDYGSLLMHRSPSSPGRLSSSQRNIGRLHDLNEHNLTRSTSSSSDTSLPPLNMNGTGRNCSGVKSSRYCHDCGTKYPISNAKFCCECGTRRLCTADARIHIREFSDALWRGIAERSYRMRRGPDASP